VIVNSQRQSRGTARLPRAPFANVHLPPAPTQILRPIRPPSSLGSASRCAIPRNLSRPRLQRLSLQHRTSNFKPLLPAPEAQKRPPV